MNEILKICGIALLSVSVTTIVGSINKNIVFALRLGGTILLFGLISVAVSRHLDDIRNIFDKILGDGFEREGEIMIKALGISFITKICSDICKDAGEGSLASGVETVGKLSLVGLALPLISSITEYVSEIFKGVA